MTPRKLLALLFALLLVLSLAACGGDDPAPGGEDPAPGGEEAVEPGGDEGNEEEIPEELKGYLGTKTGKFYSQFTDDKMYMEYEMEMEMEGMKMTMISASKGDKTYSETIIDGVSSGVSIMDGETMYTIDHTSNMVMKMGLNASAQTIAGEILEEEDVDMADLKTGTYTIDGKTYDTEEWVVDGAASIMC
ncbi:MAG: hypothetical protein IJN41_01850, partial [Firmicutes bacterium]|nr:hypothetical protein [Bacillota bacterium]